MRRAAAAAAVLAAGEANAHAFNTGADTYSQIIEGMSVPINDPAILLALLPLGIALGIWRLDGVPRVWPALVAGLIAGAAAAPLAGLWIGFAAVLAGLGVAVMGVVALAWPFWLMAAVSAGVTGLAAMAALEGHAPGSLPVPIYFGVILGSLLVTVVPAGLVSFTREEVRQAWVTIGWRVAASWIGAITMMLAALRFA